MAISSGFFRSVSGDRKYTADFFSSYFASFIGNGVFPNPSTNLQALYFQQRTVIIKAGKAWINGHYLINDEDFGITVDAPDANLSRIDRIVVGLNNDSREMSIYIKKGVFNITPIAPNLTRNNTIYEIALADVVVNPSSTTLSQANIIDQRLNNALCGLVHGLVNQIDTTTLFNQIQQSLLDFENVQEADFLQWSAERRSEFDIWYAGVMDVLDGDVAANLDNKINTLDTRLTNEVELNTERLKEITISVENYPRLGPENDDTGRIKRMFLEHPNGGNFFFPKNYIISDIIIVPPNSIVYGLGSYSSSIKWSTSNNDRKTMLRLTTNTTGKTIVHDIELDGSRSERNLVDDQSTVGIEPGDNVEIYNTRIHNIVGPGISKSGIQNITIRNNYIYDNGHHNIYFSTLNNKKYIRNVNISHNILGNHSDISARAFDSNQIKFRFENSDDIIENVTIHKNDIGLPSNNSITVFVSTTTGPQKCRLKDFNVTYNNFNKEKSFENLIATCIYIGVNCEHDGLNIEENDIFGNSNASTPTSTPTYGIRVLGDGYNAHLKYNRISDFQTLITGNDISLEYNFLSNFITTGISIQRARASYNIIRNIYPNSTAFNRCDADMTYNQISLNGTGNGIVLVEADKKEISHNYISNATNGIQRVNGRFFTNCVLDQNKFDNVTSPYVQMTDATIRATNSIEPSTTLAAVSTANRGVGRFVGEIKFDSDLYKIIVWNGIGWTVM